MVKQVADAYNQLTPEEKEDLNQGYRQLNEFRMTVLPALGVKNIYIQTGYESDDLIASIVKNNSGNFIIVTNDNDLYQLLYRN